MVLSFELLSASEIELQLVSGKNAGEFLVPFVSQIVGSAMSFDAHVFNSLLSISFLVKRFWHLKLSLKEGASPLMTLFQISSFK